MRFIATGIPGAFLIAPEENADERGVFARSFCRKEFHAHGLVTDFVQTSFSLNTHRHTLRGMHFQAEPHPETKLVRVTRGAAYDVILDLRPDSPAYLTWRAFELSEANHHALYIPGGVAHGFQTLTDGCEVFYMMSEYYHPECARGARWDDPAFGIQWPEAPARVISAKDQTWEFLHEPVTSS